MRTLPERMYFKHGAYYYVTKDKQWLRLGTDETTALLEYARVAESSEVLNTMNRVFDKYQKEVLPTKSPRTQRDNLAELKHLRAVFGAMRPTDVKPKHVAQYLALRSAKVRANREIALLQHVFRKAKNWGLVEMNPCHEIERNPEYPRDRYVTDQELNEFLSIVPRWLKLYVNLKLLLGLRQSDMLSLRWENCSSSGLEATISKTGRGNKRSGASRVRFEMTPSLRATLESLANESNTSLGTLFSDTADSSSSVAPLPSGYLFSSRSTPNMPRTNSSLDSAWDRAWLKLESTGKSLQHFREHDIRAKSATDADDLGLDASALLVHSSKKMTETYLRGRRTRKIKPLK